ncbi:MAG: phosphatidate cytidylyltransferase [Eubacteriales bacterium]|nr:phosphatidate cytidylyltransferase [Eubacteriales bacterium]
MFWVRLRSGIILVAIALLTIISGGYILFGTTLAISLIGLGELYRAVGIAPVPAADGKKAGWGLAAMGYAATLLYYAALLLHKESYSMILMIFVLIGFLAVYVFTFPRYRSEQVMAGFFGTVYVSVMLSYIYQTRMMADGAFLVWLIFLCSWGCDTCAYCVGVLIGKHKMSPILSPKKSIEGAVGGVVGAALLGAIYALVVGKYLQAENQVPIYALICAVGALISMVGDLAASAIKRNHEIKDYGTLIPGHGGIMDRFDSVIFTAPVIFFLATVMTGL